MKKLLLTTLLILPQVTLYAMEVDPESEPDITIHVDDEHSRKTDITSSNAMDDEHKTDITSSNAYVNNAYVNKNLSRHSSSEQMQQYKRQRIVCIGLSLGTLIALGFTATIFFNYPAV